MPPPGALLGGKKPGEGVASATGCGASGKVSAAAADELDATGAATGLRNEKPVGDIAMKAPVLTACFTGAAGAVETPVSAARADAAHASDKTGTEQANRRNLERTSGLKVTYLSNRRGLKSRAGQMQMPERRENPKVRLYFQLFGLPPVLSRFSIFFGTMTPSAH